MTVMLTALDDYDWEEVFKYAAQPQVVIAGNCSGAGFTRADVVEIIRQIDGQNDGDPWLGLFRLQDGRYAFIEAGCDYTGWG